MVPLCAIHHQQNHRRAVPSLLAIDAASMLNDLRAPPGNWLEALHGARKINSVFASTTSGASVLSGMITKLGMSRSSTITEESSNDHQA